MLYHILVSGMQVIDGSRVFAIEYGTVSWADYMQKRGRLSAKAYAMAPSQSAE